ncbi:MAG TPA: T9SS type A sorting domain-containing protein, partial [Bacteroidales bacterium]|nr:T9SS type A sorting domain-containing protein [Bacteroidales bacterium]
TLELKNQNNLISAFPNPNRGVFNLISKDANVDYSIKVYNLYGQIVYSGSSQNGEAKIVIQGEPVGLYLINLLYNDGRKQTIKVEIN